MTMSDTQPSPAEPNRSVAANSGPIGSPRNFVLACIGLVSLLADELPLLLERSVQRGSAVVERLRPKPGAPPQRRPFSMSAARTVSRGLPTHHDLETLLQQVTGWSSRSIGSLHSGLHRKASDTAMSPQTTRQVQPSPRPDALLC
jgi:hypothetical protein